MERFEAAPFLRLVSELTELSAKRNPLEDSLPIPQEHRNVLAASAQFLVEETGKLGLESSQDTAVKLQKVGERVGSTWGEFAELGKEFRGRLIDDMKRTLFLAVSSGDAKLYLAVLPFGKEVGRAFPSADFDIWEATKCLALDRHTACVFHLMRVMELGLHALGKSLNDPTLDPKTNPSWFKILDRCSKELKKPLAQRSPEWQADEPFYSGVAARLMAVKDAWRNETMHVKAEYNEEEARDILNHVKAFMSHLATRLSDGRFHEEPSKL